MAFGTMGILATSGCSSRSYHQFHGTIAREGSAPPARTYALGGEFSLVLPDATEGIYGVQLGEAGNGYVVCVFDKDAAAPGTTHMCNRIVTAVFFAPAPPKEGHDIFWKRFLRKPVEEREIEGIRRMHGTFDIEQWDGPDFRIRLSLSTDSPEIRIDGKMCSFRRPKFQPLLVLGQLGADLGLIHVQTGPDSN